MAKPKNIIKSRYSGDLMARQYGGEPELRPEFIKKMKQIRKKKSIRIKNFKKHFGLK